MIDAFHLGNFKAFGATQRIPVRPLTLLYGPNSGGKSSILNSLLLIEHSVKTEVLDVVHPEAAPAVDLGGFHQYVHGQVPTARVEWGVDFSTRDWPDWLAEPFGVSRSAGLRSTFGRNLADALGSKGGDSSSTLPQKLSAGALLTANRTVRLQTLKLTFDDAAVLEWGLCPDGKLRISAVNLGLPWFDRLAEHHKISKRVLGKIPEQLARLTRESVVCYGQGALPGLPHIERATSPELQSLIRKNSRGMTKYHVGIRGEKNRQLLRLGFLSDSETPSLGQRLLDVVVPEVPRGTRRQNAKALAFAVLVLDDLVDVMLYCVHLIGQRMSRFQHLGPLRKLPERHSLASYVAGDSESGDTGSAMWWDEVRRSAPLRKELNRWLSKADKYEGKMYRIENNEYFTSRTVLKYLESRRKDGGFSEETSDSIVGELEKLSEGEGYTSSLRLRDISSDAVVALCDVGTGISQVLPVLVGSMAESERERIIGLEHPDLHLHPRLQTDLADVFIDSALGKRQNTLLIETHSEHLLLRIMRRMRETTRHGRPGDRTLPRVTPGDVAVLYVEPQPTGGSVVKEIRLDEEGGLLDDWPGGFFEEGFEERFL